MKNHQPLFQRGQSTLAEQSGSTLISVLVALLIFSLGILGMVGMQAKTTSLSVQSQDRSRAAILADEIISDMWLQGTNSPTTVTAWKARVADATTAGLPNASGSISTTTNTSTSITTITVTIAWTEPSSTTQHQYFTSLVLP
ncbi:fimbrial assembly protein [Curvibacter sp. CHRR-16]|uniref:type IV pilus modification PilV family protein n=1 Tax=Curvibacter sp. CHRR-16 TaxID=2835872 RepID=UPI001BD963AE|nr:fimbrial assembly protein [Curvibacter sp. CHRR-16]MBT0571732.1 fimbrial assembly protein [Curvibacter sp. CHRR-16]